MLEFYILFAIATTWAMTEILSSFSYKILQDKYIDKVYINSTLQTSFIFIMPYDLAHDECSLHMEVQYDVDICKNYNPVLFKNQLIKEHSCDSQSNQIDVDYSEGCSEESFYLDILFETLYYNQTFSYSINSGPALKDPIYQSSGSLVVDYSFKANSSNLASFVDLTIQFSPLDALKKNDYIKILMNDYSYNSTYSIPTIWQDRLSCIGEGGLDQDPVCEYKNGELKIKGFQQIENLDQQPVKVRVLGYLSGIAFQNTVFSIITMHEDFVINLVEDIEVQFYSPNQNLSMIQNQGCRYLSCRGSLELNLDALIIYPNNYLIISLPYAVDWIGSSDVSISQDTLNFFNVSGSNIAFKSSDFIMTTQIQIIVDNFQLPSYPFNDYYISTILYYTDWSVYSLSPITSQSMLQWVIEPITDISLALDHTLVRKSNTLNISFNVTSLAPTKIFRIVIPDELYVPCDQLLIKAFFGSDQMSTFKDCQSQIVIIQCSHSNGQMMNSEITLVLTGLYYLGYSGPYISQDIALEVLVNNQLIAQGKKSLSTLFSVQQIVSKKISFFSQKVGQNQGIQFELLFQSGMLECDCLYIKYESQQYSSQITNVQCLLDQSPLPLLCTQQPSYIQVCPQLQLDSNKYYLFTLLYFNNPRTLEGVQFSFMTRNMLTGALLDKSTSYDSQITLPGSLSILSALMDQRYLNDTTNIYVTLQSPVDLYSDDIITITHQLQSGTDVPNNICPSQQQKVCLKVDKDTQALQNITLNLQNILNLAYPVSVSQLNIQITSASGFQIVEGYSNVEFKYNPYKIPIVKVFTQSNQIGAPSILTLNYSLNNMILNNSQFQITIPSAFQFQDLYQVSLDGILTDYSIADNIITLYNTPSIGRGDHNIEFNLIKNPVSNILGNNYNFTIVVISQDGFVTHQRSFIASFQFQCSESCKTCSNAPDVCSSCQEGYYLYQNSCLSQCPNYTIKVGLICVQCRTEYSCEMCLQKDPFYCRQCKPGYNQIFGQCIEYQTKQNKTNSTQNQIIKSTSTSNPSNGKIQESVSSTDQSLNKTTESSPSAQNRSEVPITPIQSSPSQSYSSKISSSSPQKSQKQPVTNSSFKEQKTNNQKQILMHQDQFFDIEYLVIVIFASIVTTIVLDCVIRRQCRVTNLFMGLWGLFENLTLLVSSAFFFINDFQIESLLVFISFFSQRIQIIVAHQEISKAFLSDFVLIQQIKRSKGLQIIHNLTQHYNYQIYHLMDSELFYLTAFSCRFDSSNNYHTQTNIRKLVKQKLLFFIFSEVSFIYHSYSEWGSKLIHFQLELGLVITISQLVELNWLRQNIQEVRKENQKIILV